ncbi:MAG: hypothetical protein ABSC93_23705, partial [Bryobacteraceae bacterium]
LEGVHQAIPEAPPANAPMYMGTPPPGSAGQPAQPASPAGTDADKLLQKYQQIGTAENHKYGEGAPGTKPPDFNIKLGTPNAGQGSGAANVPAAELPAKPASPPSVPKPDGTTKTGGSPSARPPADAPPPHRQ